MKCCCSVCSAGVMFVSAGGVAGLSCLSFLCAGWVMEVGCVGMSCLGVLPGFGVGVVVFNLGLCSCFGVILGDLLVCVGVVAAAGKGELRSSSKLRSSVFVLLLEMFNLGVVGGVLAGFGVEDLAG